MMRAEVDASRERAETRPGETPARADDEISARRAEAREAAARLARGVG